MTTEEKARRYDEALERARYYHSKGYMLIDSAIENIFPELKESEDEKIRKELIEHIKANCEVGFVLFQKFSPDDIIAWLEKQGEKSVDKLQVSGELYEHIRNTCACIDDALSSETLADINDYLSMAERSAQSAFDMIETQGEQKPIDDLTLQEAMDIAVAKCFEQGEQKNEHPKLERRWTDEDECYIGECISAIATKDNWTFEEKRKTKHWLESLKQRMEE